MRRSPWLAVLDATLGCALLVLPAAAIAAEPPVSAAWDAASRVLADSSPRWEPVRADPADSPSAQAGGATGWRMLFQQTVKVYTKVSQRGPEPDSPHVFRHCHLEILLFQPDASPAGEELPWLQDLEQVHHVRAADLGLGMNLRWFARGEVYWLDRLRKRIDLEGGDDRIALLMEALSVADEGTNTANSAGGLLVEIGPPAVPALLGELKKVNSANPDVARRCASVLSAIPGKESTAALVELHKSGDEALRKLAAYGLVHSRPAREPAKEKYLDILARGPYVAEAARAVAEAGWKEMVPALRRAHDHPESYGAWRTTFDALRQLQGSSVSKEIREAVNRLKFTNDSQDKPTDEEIARCKQVFLEAVDQEVAVVLAVELAMAVDKGDTHRTNAIGREILRELPAGVVKPLLQPLTERLPNEDDRARVRERLAID